MQTHELGNVQEIDPVMFYDALRAFMDITQEMVELGEKMHDGEIKLITTSEDFANYFREVQSSTQAA